MFCVAVVPLSIRRRWFVDNDSMPGLDRSDSRTMQRDDLRKIEVRLLLVADLDVEVRFRQRRNQGAGSSRKA